MTRVVRAVCSIFVFSLTVGVAMAQMRNSTITGTVTDQSGAVVANATVRVTNQQTNTVSVTETNAAGIYTVPYLPQGEYKVTVEAPGFKTHTSSGIVVATNATVQANAELTVGATRQMVEVKAAAAQLQTQSSTVAGGVEPRHRHHSQYHQQPAVLRNAGGGRGAESGNVRYSRSRRGLRRSPRVFGDAD